jgi:hypothetical protein
MLQFPCCNLFTLLLRIRIQCGSAPLPPHFPKSSTGDGFLLTAKKLFSVVYACRLSLIPLEDPEDHRIWLHPSSITPFLISLSSQQLTRIPIFIRLHLVRSLMFLGEFLVIPA